LNEVAEHEQNRERGSFVRMTDSDNVVAPRPAPLLSRTPAHTPAANDHGCDPGQHSAAILSEFGFSSNQISTLFADRIITSSIQHSKL
jgi:crotonobetainyl-CoA:carnitine CoA-transferase CaiB-like acyl-CoA transferase